MFNALLGLWIKCLSMTPLDIILFKGLTNCKFIYYDFFQPEITTHSWVILLITTKKDAISTIAIT